MSIIIGTAGHIDHGKSALIKALTGTDPDRLAEEQERGMTIDLGFAFLSREIAFIDVPGHERFIKNMVAGISTVDMAMLVIAADDGVMPQTREHLDILSLLRLQRGIIVLTKIDLVDADLLELVQEDVRETVRGTFLERAPVYQVSAITGAGIEQLRADLLQLAGETAPRPDRGVFWLPLDRSFIIKGFGTVVTGSVLSGSARVGDTLELLPEGRLVKVRGLQQHGDSVNDIAIGNRAAINLQNISKEELQRGDVLATPGTFKATTLMDGRLHLLKNGRKELLNRARVRLHLGTREILARVKLLEADRLQPGQSTLVQLLLEEPAVAMRRDPFVIRHYSPAYSIGGGIILDSAAVPHRRFDQKVIERLRGLENPDPQETLSAALLGHPFTPRHEVELHALTGLPPENLPGLLQQGVEQKQLLRFSIGGRNVYLHVQGYAQLQQRITATLADFHKREPLRPGMSKAELRAQVGGAIAPKLFDLTLTALVQAGSVSEQPQWVKLAQHEIRLNPADEKMAQQIITLLEASPFSPPEEAALAGAISCGPADIRRVLGALQGMGRVVRLEGELFFLQSVLDEAEKRLLEFGRTRDEITVGEFRELLGTSRKYAVPILGYFDQKGRTERLGDVRRIVIV